MASQQEMDYASQSRHFKVGYAYVKNISKQAKKKFNLLLGTRLASLLDKSGVKKAHLYQKEALRVDESYRIVDHCFRKLFPFVMCFYAVVSPIWVVVGGLLDPELSQNIASIGYLRVLIALIFLCVASTSCIFLLLSLLDYFFGLIERFKRKKVMFSCYWEYGIVESITKEWMHGLLFPILFTSICLVQILSFKLFLHEEVWSQEFVRGLNGLIHASCSGYMIAFCEYMIVRFVFVLWIWNREKEKRLIRFVDRLISLLAIVEEQSKIDFPNNLFVYEEFRKEICKELEFFAKVLESSPGCYGLTAKALRNACKDVLYPVVGSFKRTHELLEHVASACLQQEQGDLERELANNPPMIPRPQVRGH